MKNLVVKTTKLFPLILLQAKAGGQGGNMQFLVLSLSVSINSPSGEGGGGLMGIPYSTLPSMG
jgi:hypothetical protein